MAIEFGNLEAVNLRQVWANEANDFTPWLANNLNYISDAIGVPLELLETEAPVQRFSADILAFNPLDNSRVLIENQLEWSDHVHLGQILTYLAGLEAKTVVWVALGFTEAHLAAIRWLNENTAADFSFFAVSVWVVKIGDSPVVPIFEVLEQPRDWERQTQTANRTDRNEPRAETESETQMDRELGAQGSFNRDFWTHYANRHPNDGVRRGFAGFNPTFRVRGTEFTIKRCHAARNQVGLGVVTPKAWSLFESQPEALKPYLPALAQAVGIDLNEMRGTALIWTRIDIANPDNWPAAADWLHEYLEIYRRILSQPPTAGN